MFHVLILSSRPKGGDGVLFEGQSSTVSLPGKDGEFEILDFHKPIISLLKKGLIVVDNKNEFLIKGGVAKMSRQSLVAMVDM